MLQITYPFLLSFMLLFNGYASHCTENWKLLKMHSISTRADGIGTNLLDHALAVSVCDKLQLLDTYPHWVHRAGSKACFKNICGSVYHDAMKMWLDSVRALNSHNHHTHNSSRIRTIRNNKSRSGSYAEEPATVCPPFPRTSSQKTIRGIMELKQDLVSTARTRLTPHLAPFFDSNTVRHRPTQPSVCVHYRLFDVEGKKNGLSTLKQSHDCDTLIHEINTTQLPHKEWPLSRDKCRSKYQQSSYADESMVAIAGALSAKYPSHQRYLVGCDSNSRLYPEASKELLTKAQHWGFNHVQCSENTTVSDLDIHFLSQCDVLVAGHSTFSVMAMVFSRPDAVVYSPVWSGAVATGLFTKYDQSGVRSIRELLSP